MTPALQKLAIGAAASLATLIGSAFVSAAPLPAGEGETTIVVKETSLTVYSYRPACSNPTLLVVFHGLHRNARGYRDYARKVADKHCMLVVAPVFDTTRFPQWRYQHGGLVRRNKVAAPEKWTGRLVTALVAEIERAEGRKMAYSLIGHSAGAQFLMRVTASVPLEARRIVIANPGSLVWADAAVKAPYGLGGLTAEKESDAALRNYLKLPITLYLGRDDTESNELTQAPQAQEQGPNRHERGLNIYRAAEARAQALGAPFNWRLIELQGVGHSARKMFEADEASTALEP